MKLLCKQCYDIYQLILISVEDTFSALSCLKYKRLCRFVLILISVEDTFSALGSYE